MKMEALRAKIEDIREKKVVAVDACDTNEVNRLTSILCDLLDEEVRLLKEENQQLSDSIDISSNDKASTDYGRAYFEEKHPEYIGDIFCASVVSVSIEGPIGLDRSGVRQFFVDHIRSVLPTVEVRWNKAFSKLRIIMLNSSERDVRELTGVLDAMRIQGNQFTYSLENKTLDQTLRSSSQTDAFLPSVCT